MEGRPAGWDEQMDYACCHGEQSDTTNEINIYGNHAQ
jgi:hypothetical protein